MTASEKLLLFGATGDLSQRMLLPSLYGLAADGLLPADLAIVATARTSHDDDAFRAFAEKALRRFNSQPPGVEPVEEQTRLLAGFARLNDTDRRRVLKLLRRLEHPEDI